MTNVTDKIVVILGLTATGKSELSVRLAKKFGGEIVSADSRQVYRGLNIGSGKVPRDHAGDKIQDASYEHRSIAHHLIDVVDPSDIFSVADYKRLADGAIEDILKRRTVPIICGGTGFYIQAIVDNVVPPEVPPNDALRKVIANKSTNELHEVLGRLDAVRAETVERENPRRLIRAIEVATALGRVPPLRPAKNARYDALLIGLMVSDAELRSRIKIRTRERMDAGWVDEVVELRNAGISWERIVEFGLGYRCIAKMLLQLSTAMGGVYTPTRSTRYSSVLQNTEMKIGEEKQEEDLILCIETVERQYAKRQMTWFRRDKRIEWFDASKIQTPVAIEERVSTFLQKRIVA